MEKKSQYIKPELEVVVLKERLMLELPVSNGFVDDEAAKGSINFDDNQHDVLGPKQKNLWDE